MDSLIGAIRVVRQMFEDKRTWVFDAEQRYQNVENKEVYCSPEVYLGSLTDGRHLSRCDDDQHQERASQDCICE